MEETVDVSFVLLDNGAIDGLRVEGQHKRVAQCRTQSGGEGRPAAAGPAAGSHFLPPARELSDALRAAIAANAES